MIRAVLIAVLTVAAGAVRAEPWVEVPHLSEAVDAGHLPPVAERLPAVPAVASFDAPMQAGRHGGTLRMLMAREKDTRQMYVYGYARLVRYDSDFTLVPDILARVEVEGGRIFTLHLRPGHRWSDGHPFTTEAFRYRWEDIDTDPDLSPGGPPRELLVDGKPPKVEILDGVRVRYTWPKPNPRFLPMLARPRPVFLYVPAHYLKQFHAKHAPAAELAQKVKESGKRNWVALHYDRARMYRYTNPDLPTLQPWVLKTAPPATRYIFERNPYYHWVDSHGRQLPYVGRVILSIADRKLIPAKVGAGEVDLQARYLSFNNYTFLKQAEKRNGYRVHLWRRTNGSQVALYPNLTVTDPVWRRLFREADFRRALSMAIDRHEINQVIFYGLALEMCDTALPQSPLYHADCAAAWTDFDLDRANAMLDGLGLAARDDRDVRLLPDGRPMEIVVETAGESTEETDVLSLIKDSWAKIGVRLHVKPLQRDLLRNRAFSGATLVSAWFGLDNALVTPDMDPRELAPVDQTKLSWPKWGQYFETKGQSGEPVDYPPARQLLDLYLAWGGATGREERKAIWRKMLDIYADQVFSIATVSGVYQPLVASTRLRNIPSEALYGWDPGAHLGIHRPDTFWYASGDEEAMRSAADGRPLPPRKTAD